MLYDRIAANVRRTCFLIAAFILLVSALGLTVGYLIGIEYWGLVIALLIALAMSWGSYYNSDRVALSISQAQPADPARDAQLINIVEGLSLAAGIPAPRVYRIDDDAPNAFATGRDPEHAAVAVTTGLMDKLTRDQIEGVVAHELAHVKNRDILVSSIAATMAGAITMMARMVGYAAMFGGGRDRDGGGALGALAMMIVAPLAAVVIQMAVSRTREYKADATGARIVGHPHGLMSALQKLEHASQRVPVEASPTTAHMFIVRPFSGGLMGLFATHPPMQERIRRLRDVR